MKLLRIIAPATAIVFSFAVVMHISGQETLKDEHGITKLHKSEKGGMTWVADWRQPRIIDESDTKDPLDPWFTVTENSAYFVAGGGDLKISGRTPRMYVRDPELKKQWHDVEITMYFKRVSDDSTPYAGMVSVTRANHGATGSPEIDLCDSRGYGGRMRYDGYTDFEKELAHPENTTSPPKRLWLQGMPFDTWLGYKFLVYDLSGHRVKLELWLDRTGGINGGKWEKVNEFTDTGNNFGIGLTSCSPDISPALPLEAGKSRPGSESNKPNISTYFRTDNVTGGGGLIYRNGSIREISPDRMEDQ